MASGWRRGRFKPAGRQSRQAKEKDVGAHGGAVCAGRGCREAGREFAVSGIEEPLVSFSSSLDSEK